MRIRIVTTVLIDTQTGEVQSKATWKVEGEDGGLGSALAQATAALQRLQPSPGAQASEPSGVAASDSPDPSLSPPRDHPAATEARLLGGLLQCRDDVEQALVNRPAARVVEVLKWIRNRRTQTTIRSVPSLFWSLVNKD